MGPIGDKGQVWGGGRFRRLLRPVAFLAAIPLPVSAAALDPLLGDANFMQGRLLVLSALAAGAVALAVAASLWALAEQRNALRLRRAIKGAGARTKAAVGERD